MKNNNSIEEKAPKTLATTMQTYRANYTKVNLPNGKQSMNNGDPVATALSGRDHKEVIQLAEQMIEGIKRGELKKKYAHLNVGMQRMNAGNRIRAAYKREEEKVVNWVAVQNKESK